MRSGYFRKNPNAFPEYHRRLSRALLIQQNDLLGRLGGFVLCGTIRFCAPSTGESADFVAWPADACSIGRPRPLRAHFPSLCEAPNGLIPMLLNVKNAVSVVNNLEVETDVVSHSRLPNAPRLIVFLRTE